MEVLTPRDPRLDEHGQLRDECVEDLLLEILSGKHLFDSGSQLYASRRPLLTEQDAARVVYTRTLRIARGRGLPAKAELETQALQSGMIDPSRRQEKLALGEQVQRCYQARNQSTDHQYKQQLDEDIGRMRLQLLQIEQEELQILQHSAEPIAEEARTGYLVACCTLGGELLERPVWPSYADYLGCTDRRLLLDSRRAFIQVCGGLAIPLLRALARSAPWRLRWKAARESHTPAFAGPSSDWDANQRALVYWSDFYESIYAHPECPGEEVLRDDAALQNWINQQSRRRKQRTPAGGGPAVTYRQGNGKQKAMARIGGSSRQINAPYKVRAAAAK